jgi:anti-anti-sigma factor
MTQDLGHLLGTTLEVEGRGAHLTVSGALDARTAERFEAELAAVLRRHPGRVVLDLSRVITVDLAALSVIADLLAGVAHQHHRVEVVPPLAERPQALLDLTGLAPLLARFAA